MTVTEGMSIVSQTLGVTWNQLVFEWPRLYESIVEHYYSKIDFDICEGIRAFVQDSTKHHDTMTMAQVQDCCTADWTAVVPILLASALDLYVERPRSSARKVLDWLLTLRRQERYLHIIAHNGSRFDFFFILQAMTPLEILGSRIQRRGTSILSITFAGHEMHDSCTHLLDSLDNLCKSFGIKTEDAKQTSFVVNGSTLTSMQLCFYKPELSAREFVQLQVSEPEFWEVYVTYCHRDCSSTRLVWEMYKSTSRIMFRSMHPSLERKVSVNTTTTIAGAGKRLLLALQELPENQGVFQKFLQFCGEQVRIPPKTIKLGAKPSRKMQNQVIVAKHMFVREALVGGVSHVNRPGVYTRGLCSFDNVSLFPAAMVSMKIPVGPSTHLIGIQATSSWTPTCQKYGYICLTGALCSGGSTLQVDFGYAP
jgi:hypothetical protein